MHPILIKLGPITIRTYGFLFATGVLLGVLVSLRLAKKEKIDPNLYMDFAFFTMLISILGAKLFLFVTNIGYYLSDPSALKDVLLSGGTFYGGLIFGLIFAVWYIRRKKLIARIVGDVALPGLALGHFFGRLGCFAAGCCWGRAAPEHFPLAVKFSDPIAKAFSGTPLCTDRGDLVKYPFGLYPTQLAEAGLNLLNFLFLLWLFPRRRFKGQVFALYILNYSLIRFFIEYFRGDPDRGYIFGSVDQPFSSLSLPQAISIGGVILAVILYRRFRKTGAQKNLP